MPKFEMHDVLRKCKEEYQEACNRIAHLLTPQGGESFVTDEVRQAAGVVSRLAFIGMLDDMGHDVEDLLIHEISMMNDRNVVR